MLYMTLLFEAWALYSIIRFLILFDILMLPYYHFYFKFIKLIGKFSFWVLINDVFLFIALFSISKFSFFVGECWIVFDFFDKFTTCLDLNWLIFKFSMFINKLSLEFTLVCLGAFGGLTFVDLFTIQNIKNGSKRRILVNVFQTC